MKFICKETMAEFIGTFWLVLGGCGAAVLAGSKIGYAGIALAFGLTVFTMAYAVGHISGGHFNPAVSFGLWAAGRFSAKSLLPYIFAQIIGAICAAFLIWLLQLGVASAELSFAVNGYGELSPGKYDFLSAAVIEIVLTFIFLIVICGSTDKKAAPGFAPAAIGMALTLIHLIGIPVTNLSVNPARSLGPALVHLAALKETLPLEQVWLFILAPVAGAMFAGLLYKKMFETK